MGKWPTLAEFRGPLGRARIMSTFKVCCAGAKQHAQCLARRKHSVNARHYYDVRKATEYKQPEGCNPELTVLKDPIRNPVFYFIYFLFVLKFHCLLLRGRVKPLKGCVCLPPSGNVNPLQALGEMASSLRIQSLERYSDAARSQCLERQICNPGLITPLHVFF